MSTTYNCVHYDRDLMRSCIYGLAVGDAFGVPYEFCERGTFECTDMVGDGTHGQHAGTAIRQSFSSRNASRKGSAMTEYEPAGAKRRLFMLIEQASEEHQ